MIGDEGSLRVWLFIYQGWASLALPDLVCPCTTLLTAAFGDCSELLTTGEKPNKYIKGIGTNHNRQKNCFVNSIAFCLKIRKVQNPSFWLNQGTQIENQIFDVFVSLCQIFLVFYSCQYLNIGLLI